MASDDNPYANAPVSRVERALLCDLLEAVGPAAPTLCTGWDTHHLVAHLYGREANPIRSALSVVPRLGDASVNQIVARHDFVDLIARVRSGPPLLSAYGLPYLDAQLNGLEFFVHHEDVRRAAAGWERRVLPAEAENQLWPIVCRLARLAQRRARTPLTLERRDAAARLPIAKGTRPGTSEVVVRGFPSELGIYALGRYKHADVDMLGTADAIATLTNKPVG